MTENKSQLISLICLYLETRAVDLLQSNNRHVLTGAERAPFRIFNAHVSKRPGLHTTHGDADIIIIQHVFHLAESCFSSICVVADDTDVFILLL